MNNTFDCYFDGEYLTRRSAVATEPRKAQNGVYSAAAMTHSYQSTSTTSPSEPFYPDIPSDPNPPYNTSTTMPFYPDVPNPNPGKSTTDTTTTTTTIRPPATTIIPVTSIVLDTTSIKLPAESKFDLHETVYPENATNRAVRWETDNAAVATVGRYSGRVTAVAVGQANIYCIAKDGNHAKAICQVTVVSKVPDVTVISATTPGFLSTSKTMGEDMASAMGWLKRSTVKATKTALEFANNWSMSGNCVIIHTHGSPNGLFDGGIDENGNSVTPQIISLDEIKNLPANPNIKFLLIVSCSCAGGSQYNNVASWLSQKIDPEGIVIANRYIVNGTGPIAYGWDNGQKTDGWVVYQNGLRLHLPVTINMEKGYDIYRLFADTVS